MAVVAGDQSLCRDAGERRGPHCPLDRRTSPDRELVAVESAARLDMCAPACEVYLHEMRGGQ